MASRQSDVSNWFCILCLNYLSGGRHSDGYMGRMPAECTKGKKNPQPLTQGGPI